MRISVMLLVLWTIVNLVLTVRLNRSEPAVVVSTDPRTAVQLPVEARDAVLAEMRTMLGSVQGVLDGAARSDTAAIRGAAKASGLVMAADPALEAVLPPEFLRLGMRTHQAFDTLAATASAGAAPAVARLAEIASGCVACHAAYRLEVQQ
jgi:cytochrome c556